VLRAEGCEGISARFDDLVAGTSVVLTHPRTVVATDRLDEVRAVVSAAEDCARAGSWVALVVAYEAGPAFDAAQRVPPAAPGLPLAWFATFADAVTGPPIHVTTPVTAPELSRRGGTAWYVDRVDRCRETIAEGDAYQVNLTDRLVGRFHGDPTALYAQMARAQGGAFNALITLPDRTIVSASPELFFEVRGDTIASRPMKGTVARRPRADDDAAAAAWLLASEKDRAENVMITDLLRNDIGRIAEVGSVRVPALFELERYETVWQLTSTIEGTIGDEVRLVDMFGALFPCGSVTGAPKVSAMRWIADAEPWPRGVYCGTIGLIRPCNEGEPRPNATFSVAIRTAIVHHADGTIEYGAGCGITADSIGELEDIELEAKTAVIVRDRPDHALLETMRVEHGVVNHLALHLERMEASSRYFGFTFDRDAVARACAESASSLGTSATHRLRLVVDRCGHAEVTVDPIDLVDTVVSIALSRTPMRSDDVFTCHKTTSRRVYEDAAAERPDVDDVVLANERGEVVESCRANVLYRIDDRWFTPPLSSGGLAGVGRRLLLDLGVISERVLLVAELPTIDEVHLVSALRGRRRAVWSDRP
jgi:para-aminobenzoate synthetase/4-amino-4-deoxychorismate lyase